MRPMLQLLYHIALVLQLHGESVGSQCAHRVTSLIMQVRLREVD